MARLDNEEIRAAVKHYVRAAGVFTDAWIVAGFKNESGFYTYLKAHPEFHQELKDIKYFSDPAVNVALIKKAHKALEDNLTLGAYKNIFEVDPETGKQLTLKRITSGASKWAVELILKSPTVTEMALKIILASLIHDLSRSKISDEMKIIFYKFLDEFKRKQLIELIQKGCPVREEIEDEL